MPDTLEDMNYLHFDLGHQEQGAAVSIAMEGVESDAFLVDDFNYANFRRGSHFKYYGGHYKKSPAVITVPAPGHWQAVVVPGAGGAVRASARVIG